jgi:Asp/Glu/hydantoin racemase
MPGKNYYGVSIGVLMVNTRFRRFVGDIGNARTWSFPVQYKVVEAARAADMVALESANLLEPFKAAAAELVDEGVDGIVTTCGFLALYQQELVEHAGVPVVTSALLQVPWVRRLLPVAKEVAVLTYNAQALGPRHLHAVGVTDAVPVFGMPQDSDFVRSIRDGDDSVPFEVLRGEVLAVVSDYLASHPQTGALVLECTNLTPFSSDIQQRFGIPVFDMVTLVNWFHHGLNATRFPRGD